MNMIGGYEAFDNLDTLPFANYRYPVASFFPNPAPRYWEVVFGVKPYLVVA
jgi:hypothetical protein